MDETIKDTIDELFGKDSPFTGDKPDYSRTMPMIALRGLTVFPDMVIHFDVGREKSILALERAMMLDQTVFLVPQKDVDIELPVPDDIYTVGTVAKIRQMLKLPGDSIRVLIDGKYRARIQTVVQETPYFLAAVEPVECTEAAKTPDVQAKMRMARSLFGEYVEAHPNFSSDALDGLDAIDAAGRLADVIASNMDLKTSELQQVMEEADSEARLDLVIEFLGRETEILRIENAISSKVKAGIDKSQREYYLREQMKVIQEELGSEDSPVSEVAEWRRLMEKLTLPEVVARKLEKEIDHMSKIPSSSPDASVIRNYVEWILDLPWNESSEDNLDLNSAEKILDEDHYGLEKVKERIVEYLAVRQLAGSNKGSILCLVGPPGVGKTSIARSVARAMGREFVHMSLGGVRDEAEIRGHRRTYIGAIPGRVISVIKECGKNNPLFLFDEVDKISRDITGDPASALLEVLDPEQNKEFVDHYLEVPFDLSNVLFLTTANTTETIPGPLLDRMEVISLSGYTKEEKFNIAKKYLVPKQIKANGLTSKQITIRNAAINELIDYYTRESGVRNLEKEIANLCRKTAKRIVEGSAEKLSIGAKEVGEMLGKRRFHFDKLLGKSEIGVATGLAWTQVGGETLFIETAILPGTGRLELTGQLGDVMQESAKAAISFIRSKASQYGIQESFYKDKDIHIHIPEGAVPKDGPSAGVTMCTSVLSALTGRRVRKDVAMTGEISLRGNILPVGGIKEKVLAAHRMGISTILLPKDNKPDLDELPEQVRNDIRFVLISKADDALKEALI
ncbi:MAG: endopeptidase La [Firmicutes bacterium]|nr:endopeptidase La [Bacillota bacterium]